MITRNTFKAAACSIAASGLFISPASAQMQLLTLEPTSEWTLQAEPDRCRITRDFGEGDNQTTLSLEKGLSGSGFNLVVIGAQVDKPYSDWVRFQFGPDEKVNNRKFVAGKTPNGKPMATIPSATFAPRVEEEYRTFARDKLDKGRLGAIQTLAVKLVAAAPFELKVGAMDLPMIALSRCMDERRAEFSIEHAKFASHPEPSGSAGTWITSADYPTDLLLNRVGTLVEFSLVVDDQGTPNFCEIKPSTRPQRIDETLCAKLLQRARFSPALNKDGEPAPDTWTSSIRFEIKK
jgi:hypothetical protein